MAKRKYYVVWNGRRTGVFNTWAECQQQIHGYSGARYKSFPTRAEAESAYQAGCDAAPKANASSAGGGRANKASAKATAKLANINSEINFDSVAVDAACSGNPGVLEYQGVDTKTGEPLFHEGPFAQGTVNIGEFLAIVDALRMLQQESRDCPIYSDSQTAIIWVRKGKANTKMERSRANAKLFDRIKEAEEWLASNDYSTPILKWRTDIWGEIPADFGRK